LPEIKYIKIIAGKFQFNTFYNNLIGILKLIIGFFQSIILILKFRPKVIFLKGNYATFPVAYAAKFFRIPIVAHESDAVIGKSNKLIANFSKKLFVSYPIETYNYKKQNIQFSGPILRDDFNESNSKFNRKNSNLPMILVLGGSQGAHAINKLFFSILNQLLSNYEIIHQTGINDFGTAKERIKLLPKKISDNYHPIPFIEENSKFIADADLIVSRASSSVFEFGVFGKPTILIPYPYASLNHQLENAKYFAGRRAAIVLEEKNLSPTILFSAISKIMSTTKRRKELGANLKNSVKLDGKKTVYLELEKYLNK
jgi:UDP-N-acetylglucosamine--N-acetylmuramyl-(pentapeptide) pyrophosphoryl-undecaprenol N-acetylglucosamine transferase